MSNIHAHVTYVYIPGTQLTPVLIGKGHMLGGWWSKIEVIQVLGIYALVESHRLHGRHVCLCHDLHEALSSCHNHLCLPCVSMCVSIQLWRFSICIPPQYLMTHPAFQPIYTALGGQTDKPLRAYHRIPEQPTRYKAHRNDPGKHDGWRTHRHASIPNFSLSNTTSDESHPSANGYPKPSVCGRVTLN